MKQSASTMLVEPLHLFHPTNSISQEHLPWFQIWFNELS